MAKASKSKNAQADKTEQAPAVTGESSSPKVIIPTAQHARVASKEVHQVLLSEIKPDPNQPRKFFRQEEIDELVDSFTKHGLLQSIVIRPKDDGFYIVFGERRYRAAIQAGFTHIEARIKPMSDEEALEVQIIENLQRADVHPMEEAGKLAILVKAYGDNGHKEVAERIGKSERYVAVRVKLTELLPDFQEMFYLQRMSFDDAKLLSRQSTEVQQHVYDNRIGKRDWRKGNEYHFNNLEWMLKQTNADLTKAGFKLSDAKLYPEAGACTVCPHNSKNNLALFEEKEHKCYQPVCFETKVKRAYDNKINKVIETEPDTLFIVNTTYLYNDTDKEHIEQIKERGIAVLQPSDFTKFEEPDEKPDWEEFKEENSWRLESDDEDEPMSEEDIKREEAEIKEEFDSMLENWQIEYDRYHDALKKGTTRKAFVVAGGGEGKIIDIVLLEKGAAKADAVSGSDTEEIDKIMKREIRAKELDGEKVWLKIRALAVGEMFMRTDPLTAEERSAFAMALYETLGYYETRNMDELMGFEEYDESMKRSIAFENTTDEQLSLMCRMLIKMKLFPAYGSHLRTNTAYWGKKVTEQYNPDAVKEIEILQEEVAAKRAVRVEKKIATLQKATPSAVDTEVSDTKPKSKKSKAKESAE